MAYLSSSSSSSSSSSELDVNAMFGEEVLLEFSGLNEFFQNIFENPYISLNEEATKRINKIPKLSLSKCWPQVKYYIEQTIQEKTDRIKEGFTTVEKGLAGGKKLAGMQTFVKICDQSIGEGKYEDYSHAAKVAGHDLKGLAAVLSCYLSGLHVPLMFIVDFMGHRALVMTKLPIGDDTQINKYENLETVEKQRQLQKELDKQREELDKKRKKIDEQQKELDKQKEIDKQHEQLDKQRKEIDEQQKEIDKQQQKIDEQQKEIDKITNETGFKILKAKVERFEKFACGIAEKFHLKKHKLKKPETQTYQPEIQTDKPEIQTYFPFDLDVHEGKDGRIYAVDLARLMPSVCPNFYNDPNSPPNSTDLTGKLSYLFRLFRTEFMRNYPFALLSADSFVPSYGSTSLKEDTLDVLEATKYLQQKLIPRIASEFSDKNQPDAATLKNFMHEKGINLRYLGLFLYHLEDQKKILKEHVLQVEMVARAYTHLMNTIMRETKFKVARDSSIRDLFQDILHCNWGEYIPVKLQAQFKNMYVYHLLDEQAQQTNKLFDHSKARYWESIIKNNSKAIFDRVSELTGIKTNASDLNKFEFVCVEKKIQIPVSPEAYIAKGEYLKAISWFYSSMRLKKLVLGDKHLRVAIALIYLAEAYVELSIEAESNYADIYFDEAIDIYETVKQEGKLVVDLEYAAALERKAKYLIRYKASPNWEATKALLDRAENIKKSINIPIELAKTKAIYAWLAYLRGEYELSEQKYKQSVDLVKEADPELLNMLKVNFARVCLAKATKESEPKFTQVRNAKVNCDHARWWYKLKQDTFEQNEVKLKQNEDKLKQNEDKLKHIKYKLKHLKYKLKQNETKLKPIDLVRKATIEDQLGNIHLLIDSYPALAYAFDNPSSAAKPPPVPPVPPAPPAPSAPPSPIDPHSPPAQASAQTPVKPQAPSPNALTHLKRARLYFETALQDRQQVCEDDHYLIAFSRDHMAQVMLANNNDNNAPKIAYNLYKDALRIIRKSLGRHHPAVGKMLHNIAIWFAHQNNFVRAREAQDEAVYILRRAYGDKHHLTEEAVTTLRRYHAHFHQPTNAPRIKPMNHEGTLAPDQPDPASFSAPYEDEVQSEESKNALQTFHQLLLAAGSSEEELNNNKPDKEVIKKIKEAVLALDLTESKNEKKGKIRRQTSLPLTKQARFPLERQYHTMDGSGLRDFFWGPIPPFEFDEINDLKIPEAKIVDSPKVGQLPPSTHQTELHVSALPSTGKLGEEGREEEGGESEAKEEEVEEVEEHEPTSTSETVDLQVLADRLNPYLKHLSKRKWDDLVHFTCDLLRTSWLLKHVKPLHNKI